MATEKKRLKSTVLACLTWDPGVAGSSLTRDTVLSRDPLLSTDSTKETLLYEYDLTIPVIRLNGCNTQLSFVR